LTSNRIQRGSGSTSTNPRLKKKKSDAVRWGLCVVFSLSFACTRMCLG